MEQDPPTAGTPAEASGPPGVGQSRTQDTGKAPGDERAQAANAPGRGRSPFEPLVEAVERAAVLDGPASALASLYREAFSPPALKAALRGDWLGHAVHPVLSDVVVGTLLSASLLDVIGGDENRRARHRLIATALAAAAPTAMTGGNDWAEEAGDDGVRRAGLVHALSNSTALALYAGSMTTGRRRAVALRAAGAAALGAGAYLGGHLSFVKGVGVDPGRSSR